MDAHAHLLSLGWAGPGHALDARPYKQKGHRGLAYDPEKPKSSGNGLIKPLLVSQRHGKLGIGKKVHEPQAGNEWWLKGFENALGNIGKSESERSSGTATPELTGSARKHTGLYSFFVKGPSMEGTIARIEKRSSTKRKRDTPATSQQEVENEAKPVKAKESVSDFEQVGVFMALRDSNEKQHRRAERSNAMEEFTQIGGFFDARSKSSKKKRKSKDVEPSSHSDDEENATKLPQDEIPNQATRRLRREQKEARKLAERGQHNDKTIEDKTAKALRKAERKRRKEEEATEKH